MQVAERTLNFVRGLLKSYGPSNIKKRLWDEEFGSGKWNFIDDTRGDCVYPFIEQHARNGDILDLGCGPGNTANEMDSNAYRTYVGVDISELALEKGRQRSASGGRGEKNVFELGDFLSYVPSQHFDVILFRESMYHVPLGKIKTLLDRYAHYLRPGGAFVVRMNATGGKLGRPKAMVDVMASEFDVLERKEHGPGGPTVIVFRPRAGRDHSQRGA